MLLVPEKVVRSELAMDRGEAFGISYCFGRCFHLGLIQEAKVCVACAHHEPEAFTDRVGSTPLARTLSSKLMSS